MLEYHSVIRPLVCCQFLGVNTVYCVLTTVVSMFTECIFVRWFLDTYLDAC